MPPGAFPPREGSGLDPVQLMFVALIRTSESWRGIPEIAIDDPWYHVRRSVKRGSVPDCYADGRQPP